MYKTGSWQVSSITHARVVFRSWPVRQLAGMGMANQGMGVGNRQKIDGKGQAQYASVLQYYETRSDETGDKRHRAKTT